MIPKTPFQYQLWINGKEVPSGSGKKFERKSPAHGTVVGEYARADAADVAERWGLANEVVPVASLSDRVTELAEKIAGNAPVAVQTAKQLIANPSSATLESLAAAVNAFSDDAKEGLAAFREKRSPKFEGR